VSKAEGIVADDKAPGRRRVLRGERLRAAREARGLTQDELAVRLGFGQSQMNKYENGKSDPTPEVLVRLATALEVSVDWLLGLVDAPDGHLTPAALSPQEQRLIAAWRGGDFKKLLQIAAQQGDD
jgi:transcriptional regulator with XRE-family HTH domain